MKFTNVEQVQREFKNRANGGSKLKLQPNVRYNDLNEHKEDIENLLKTEYNTLVGYNFEEIIEGISNIVSNDGQEYYNDCKVNNSPILESLNESFYGTTQAQAPFPVPNKALTMYHYEKSVLPYLAHMFDLKGNRGLAYYIKLVAANTIGGVTADDVLASPKQLGTQTKTFASTKATNKVIATTVSGQSEINFIIPNFPIAPQTLTITVDGIDGYLKDISSSVAGDEVTLANIDGKIGDCTIDLNTGVGTLILTDEPTQTGVSVKATYDRDVQTADGGTNNQARVNLQLDSVTLEAEDYSIASETNVHQQSLARAIFGLDWNQELDDMLAAVYNREIANKITSDIRSGIGANSIFTHDLTNESQTGDTAFFKTAFFPVVVNKLSNLIAKASGLTGLNKVSALVANVDILPIIQALPKFKSVETGENWMGGMAVVGTYDNLPVLAGYDPIVETGEVIAIYKSKDKPFLTPAVFGTFILPLIRDVFSQDNLAINKKQLIASAASKVVVPNLASKLIVTGLDTIL